MEFLAVNQTGKILAGIIIIPLLQVVQNNLRIAKITILRRARRGHKKSYEHHVYESVCDRSLS